MHNFRSPYDQIILSLTWTILSLFSATANLSSSTSQKVIMIGFDGFRPDYLKRELTPTLNKIMKEGISTRYLQNVFPTKTFTNFFSIATGMYAENHGVLGKTVFNKTLDCIKYSSQLFHYNEDILPIWTLNELTGNGRHSGTMMWASSEFEFRNTKPSFSQKYNVSMSWHDRVETSISWLLNKEKPVNFLCMYFEQPDSASHYFGVHSNEVNEQLKRVDDILQYILRQLTIHNLEKQVNLIILSDHGMVDIDKSNIINITKILGKDSFKCGTSPVLQIAAKRGKEKETYNRLIEAQNQLKTFSVYKWDEIPERWHFKHNKRSADILLVANSPYAFDDENSKANHGYDNAEKTMHAFFTATGPMFRKNFYMKRPFFNIDIYALISYILELDVSLLRVKPNGTLSTIMEILDIDFSRFQSKVRRELLKYFIPETKILQQTDENIQN